MIALPSSRRKTREAMLAYISLTAAEATLIHPDLEEEPTSPNCRVTIVPGRLLLAPHRAAARKGLEPQEYAWPAIALLPLTSHLGEDASTTPLLIDVGGRMATLYVELPTHDVRWALQECGFRVVEAPYVAHSRQAEGLRRVWVQEEVRPLLPVSVFTSA